MAETIIKKINEVDGEDLEPAEGTTERDEVSSPNGGGGGEDVRRVH